MADAPAFGRWLKQRRHALDLTQDALAEQVGCSTDTIRKLEAERTRASRLLAERLAEQLAPCAGGAGGLCASGARPWILRTGCDSGWSGPRARARPTSGCACLPRSRR